MDEEALRELAEQRLRDLAGPDAELHDDQWSAIRALVLDRQRALVVQRTGWGKSAVYFIATALLRELGEGPTVIVSPLLALMRNQVEAATHADVHAAAINSANPDEWESIEERIAIGEVDVLLVSPERLNNPEFRDNVLPRLTETAGLLVVDEAHCISDWGHDFRPDYRRLRTLLTELPDGVPVLATTATANDRVVQDVAEQLGVGESRETLVLRGSLDRESLRLGVVRQPTARARLAWLAEQLQHLPGSGIIYVLTVAATEEIANFLRDQGYAVAAYSGRTDAAQRQQAEEDLLSNEVKALVATSALGMGFDKPDLGFVVHVGSPSSPIAYYQQIGRAGRGVRRAEVILLPAPEDQNIWSYFASLAFPPERTVRAVLEALGESSTLSTAALEPHVELGRARLEMVLKVLDVDGAVHRVKGGWQATGQPWHYDTERYQRIADERASEQRAMLEYLDTAECRLEFLRRQLDDPYAEPCGRCDACTGRGYTREVDENLEHQAQDRLSRPGVEVSPRTMWPTGLNALGIGGKIPAAEQLTEGRAVGRLTDLGWGNPLRQLLGDAASDQPLPDVLYNACIQVLAAWDWERRPVGVVAIESLTRPQLVHDLSSRIATIGQLPLLGQIAADPHSAPRQGVNSAQRVSSLWQRFEISDELAHHVSTLDGPILLMDDYTDTGWTLAIAGRQLREAGASEILPFTLATTT